MQGGENVVDVAEVYFLVLQWLSSGPCRAAAQALLQDVEQHGLLPRSYSVAGGDSRPMPYQQLLQQHSRVPSTALPQLLQQALEQVQQRGYAGAEGLSTLLAEGPLAALPDLQQPVTPAVPLWARRQQPAAAVPQQQQLLLRELGARRSSSCSSWRLPLRTTTTRFCHHATFRGHGFPVFSLLFDKQGSRIVTGADDANIKIWSLQTGLLLVCARGHTGEITDLGLSCDGHRMASGGTDGEVRIWSMREANLGQNLAVLRGHQGPINLLSFHPSLPAALLSAANDGTLRLWDAADQHIAPLVLAPTPQAAAAQAVAGPHDGAQVDVLPRTASASAATAAAAARAAGNAGSGAGRNSDAGHLLADDAAEDDAAAMFCCGWSPDGRYLVGGNTDGNVYMWRWDLGSNGHDQAMLQQQQDKTQPGQQPQDLHSTAAPAAEAPHAADWTQPVALPVLAGHSKSVWQVEFNHAGGMLATASMDGTVQVWALSPTVSQGDEPSQSTGPGAGVGSWQLACPPLQLVRIDPVAGGQQHVAGHAASPAPKQKQRKPMPEGLKVNRIMWVADDSKLLAAGSDNVIRVWSTKDWSVLALLLSHTDAVHVLTGHPFDPRLVLSAGYDGLSILWDCEAGVELQRLSSSDTPPLARGSWAPPVIQVVEGRFSPDGTSFVVADVAGQFSIYALGPPPPLLLAAPYDQFFSRDYDPITHDTAGFAAYADPNTGVVVAPVWQAARQYAVGWAPALQQALCDNHFRPYPEGFQLAYRTGRVLDYVRAGCDGMSLRGSSMSLTPSLEQWPPTVTAGVWKALEDRTALAAIRSSLPSEQATRDAAERSALEQHRKLLAALARGMTLEEEQLHVAQVEAATAAAAAAAAAQGPPEQHHMQQPAGAAGAPHPQQVDAASRRQGSALAAAFISEEDVLQDIFEDRDGMEAALPDSDSDYSASAQQDATSSSDGAEDLGSDGGYSHGSGSAGWHGRRRTRRSQRRASGRSRRERHAAATAAAAAAAGGGHNLRPRRQRGGSSAPEGVEQGVSTRLRPHTRSAAVQGGTPDPEHLQQLPLLQPRQRKRSRQASDTTSTDEQVSSSSGNEGGSGCSTPHRSRQRQRQPRRTHRRVEAAAAAATASPPHIVDEDDAALKHALEQRGRSTSAQALAAAAAAPGADTEGAVEQNWRPEACYSWLTGAQQMPGLYVPQLGDAVVYIWQEHQRCLDSMPSLQQEGRPWMDFKQLGLAAWQQQQLWQQQQQQQQQIDESDQQQYCQGQQERGKQAGQQQSYDPGGEQALWQQQLGQGMQGQQQQQSYDPGGQQQGRQQQQQELGQPNSKQEQQAFQQNAADGQTAPDEPTQPDPAAAAGSKGLPGAIQPDLEAAGKDIVHQAPAAGLPPVCLASEAAAAAAGSLGSSTPTGSSMEQPTQPVKPEVTAAAASAAQHSQEHDLTDAQQPSTAVPVLAPANTAAAAAVDCGVSSADNDAAFAGDTDAPPPSAGPAVDAPPVSWMHQQQQQQQQQQAATPFQLRPAEPCVVIGLEYVLLPDDGTAARLTLQLSDPAVLAALASAAATGSCSMTLDPTAAAALAQGCFQVLLPPPQPVHKVFVLLQSHYLSSLGRCWKPGDRVQRFHSHGAGMGGSWQHGSVTAAAESTGQLSDPYSCSMGRCYQVCWDDSDGTDGIRAARAAAAMHAATGHGADAGAEPAAAPAPAPGSAHQTEDAGLSQQDHPKAPLQHTQLEAAAAAAEGGPQADTCTQAAVPCADSPAAGTATGATALPAATDAAGAAAGAAAEDAPAGGTSVRASAQLATGKGSWHSPWELYASDLTAADILAAEHASGLTAAETAHMLHKVERLSRSQHKFFRVAPEPDACFAGDDNTPVRVYNRVVPLPLGLSNIQARLEAGYYRSMQALLHDVTLIASNASTFNGAQSSFASKGLQMYDTLAAEAYQLQMDADAGNNPQWQQQMMQGYAGYCGYNAAAAAGGGGGEDGSMPVDASAMPTAAGAVDWQQQWAAHSGMQAGAYAAAYVGGGEGWPGAHMLEQQQQHEEGWLQQAAAMQAAGLHEQWHHQQQQQQGTAAPFGSLQAAQQQPQQQRQPLRLRMKLRLPAGQSSQRVAAAAAAAEHDDDGDDDGGGGGGGGRPRRMRQQQGRSSRHQQQQQPQREQRSRRSAAQRAMAFVADYAAIDRVERAVDSDETELGSDSSEGGGGRPGRVTRHSARLQQQQQHEEGGGGDSRRHHYGSEDGDDYDGFGSE